MRKARRRIVLAMLAGGALILTACQSGGLTGPGAPAASKKPKGPSLGELMKPGPAGERTLGSPGAPVTIIEYASLTCPFCAAFHDKTFPALKRKYIDTGKVFYILREFPIGRTAGAAAMVARCAPKEEFIAIVERFMRERRSWVSQNMNPDSLFAIAKNHGLSRAEFDSCLANQKLVEDLNWVKQRGREFGVIGTPTFFVNGKSIRGAVTLQDLEALIRPHLG